MQRTLPALRDLIDGHFGLAEFRSLCFNLGLDYDNLAGETKRARVESLLDTLDNSGRLAELIALLEKERPNVAWTVGPAEGRPNPYRGLSAFREEDADNFFGREETSRQLLSAVEGQSLVAVIGPSGSGKSSLVYAGLLPKLGSQGGWVVVALRPGPRPVRALAAALLPLLEAQLSETDRLVETGKLATALTNGDIDLQTVVERILEKSTAERLLLVIDQFEELYTLCPDEDARQSFLDKLLGSIDTDDVATRLTRVITLRADFMSQVLGDGALAGALQGRTFMLGPMTPAGLREVVEQPAIRSGAAFEVGLVERLLNDVGAGDRGRPEPGNLPLLEFALTLLWERQEAGRLTHAAYEAIGQVQGALAGHADAVYGGLDPAGQERARRVFMQMVQPGLGTEDTRRLATGQELGQEGWELARELAGPGARLVVAGTDESGRETAEIIHEALIQRWGRLQGWLEMDRTFRLWQERLRVLLGQWRESKEDEGALLRGAPLAEAEGWLAERPDDLSPAERDFIKSSVAEREQEAADREAARQRELAQQRALAEEQRQRAEEAEAASTQLRRRRNLAFGLAAGALALAILAAILFGQSNNNARRAENNLGTATVALGEAEIERQRADGNAATATRHLATAVVAQEDAAVAAEQALVAQATAQADRDLANRQAQIALARQLVAEANTVRGLDYNLLHRSTLLAVEGASRLDELGLPSLEADLILRQNLKLIPRRTGIFQCGREGDVLFSTDGEELILACEIVGTRIWDLASREATSEILAADWDHLALSPEGDFVLSAYDYGGSNGTATVYDIRSGSEIRNFNYDGPAERFALSQDGAYLALSNTFDGFVQVWEVSTGKEVVFLQQEEFVYDISFNPTDQTLLIASGNGIVMVDLENVQSDDGLNEVESFSQLGIITLAFSPDGHFLAGRSFREGRLMIWEVANQEVVQNLDLQNYGQTSLAISTDGRFVANVIRENSLYVVQILDVASGELYSLDASYENPPLAFSPAGTMLAAGGAMWELAQFSELASIAEEQEILQVEFSPGEDLLSVVSGPTRVDDRPVILSAVLDPTSALQSGAEEQELTIRAYPLGEGGKKLQSSGEIQQIASIISGNGQRLATADDAGEIQVIDLNNPQEPKTFHAGGRLETMTLSIDGRQLGAAGDGRLMVWDVDENQEHLNVAYEGFAQAISLAAEDVYLITLETYLVNEGTRGESQVWEARAWRYPGGQEVWNYDTSGPGFQSPPDIFASTNSQYWVLPYPPGQQRMLSIVDLSTGREIGTIGHPEAGVSHFAFNADGRYIATEGQDNTVRVWDTTTQREIARIEINTTLDALQLSPAGRYLATVTGQTLQIWTLSLGDLVDEACAHIPRNLTFAEWENHLPGERYSHTCPEIPLQTAELVEAARAYVFDENHEYAAEIYRQAVEIATTGENTFRLNQICREGSLAGFAEIVLPACDRAVELSPEDGDYHDNRGIARALTGEYDLAIEDFRLFVESLQADDQEGETAEILQIRQRWIEALQAGKNPLDSKTIADLQNQ